MAGNGTIARARDDFELLQRSLIADPVPSHLHNRQRQVLLKSAQWRRTEVNILVVKWESGKRRGGRGKECEGDR